MPKLLPRNIAPVVRAALRDTPVVTLTGPRQAGKSTLVQQVLEEGHRAVYVTLDDAAVRNAARADPAGFLAGFDGPVAIDEVHRVPDLFLAIKASVDRDRRPGRYLLTGSADVLLLPSIADSLAGRMDVITVWPLSQGEIASWHDSFVDALFARSPFQLTDADELVPEITRRALRGGYPEVVARGSAVRRRAWFESYLRTMLERDVRELAAIERLADVPALLRLLASRSMSILNMSEISRAVGLNLMTLKRYLALLETTFLFRRIPSFSRNLSKRVVQHPKVMFLDTGLLGHELRSEPERLQADPVLRGPLFENFVASELAKQLTWSKTRADLYHWRSHEGREVDLVLEAHDGRVVGIEVKAATTVGADDFRGLRALAQAAGGMFHRGVVLYTGRQTVPFGRDLHAIPMSALWAAGQPVRVGAAGRTGRA